MHELFLHFNKSIIESKVKLNCSAKAFGCKFHFKLGTIFSQSENLFAIL